MSATRVRSITVSTRCLRSAGGTPLILRDERQVLAHRHVGIERRRLRQIAGAALGFDRLVEDVEAGDDRLALGGRHVAGEDAHRRRLAGAVRPEEPEDFAPFDPEADVVDGRKRGRSAW